MKTFRELRESLNGVCWKGYEAVGMKEKNGKKVPNCVSVKEDQIEEAIKLGSKVVIHNGPKDVVGKIGRVGEIRHGAHKKADKTYTVDHDSGSVQLGKENIKLYKEEKVDESRSDDPDYDASLKRQKKGLPPSKAKSPYKKDKFWSRIKKIKEEDEKGRPTRKAMSLEL